MTFKQNMVCSFLSGVSMIGMGFDLSNVTLVCTGAGFLALSVLMYLNGES